MKRTMTYTENYKGIKIYQYDDDKKYTATPYIYSIVDKDLKNLKVKIDEFKHNDIIKYIILD